MTQLELHKEIEEFFKAGVGSADVNVAKGFFVNNDAKRFFFSRADASWLNWFCQDNFFEEISKKSEDQEHISYHLPELDYLTRVAEKEPVEIAKIIGSIKISESNFNPEVIDRFLWIINSLPARQIKELTAKIRDERWVYLMRNFRKSGYEFEKIVKILVEEGEDKAILELAQAIFIVKNKVETAEKESNFYVNDPFYISDLDASNIFEAIVGVGEDYAEEALRITTGTMAEIVKLSEPDETKIFKYADLFALFDIDFFTLKIEKNRGLSYREDVKNLAATIKVLTAKNIGGKCDNTKIVETLFDYIDKLPSCRSMWRLRLFVLTQCPKVFKNNLKTAFFKIFDVGERYFEIEGGAEYYQALIQGFSILDPKTEQRDYIKKVLEYFWAELGDNDKEEWRKRDGEKILSFIKGYLTAEENKEIKEKFKISLDEISYSPKPIMGEIVSGSVCHVSPANLDEYRIEQIIINLKSEWTPGRLNERFKTDNHFNPRGIEGLGDAIKENIKKRTNEYLESINSFFDRDIIHPHYLCSLLRGIEEMLRNKKMLDVGQVGQILGLFEIIKSSGEETPFKKKDDKSWLSDWIEVHRVIADILLYVLEDQDREKRAEIQKNYRAKIKDLIFYLFTIKDSPLKEDEKPEYGDPYQVAINSVRGRAYEIFVVFTENDGKVLAEDTKELYKKALFDNSLAVRFVIGRYLAVFYFRGQEFIIGLLPEIFPKDDKDKKDIYLATWEGYLSNTLYDKLYIVLRDYYSYAITLDSENYTKRKYFKGLDESLAAHIALAFAHLDLKISDSLFVQFWGEPNVARHKEFISFIGRSCLSSDYAGEKWLEEHKVSKEKLIEFWDWALKNVSEPEVLSGFGFWVNPNKEILDDNVVAERIAQTVKISNGDIDWDYSLLNRLPIFAEKNKSRTLEIIYSYLLDSKQNLNQNRRTPFLYRDEIKEALMIIYKNSDSIIKQKVIDLINILIEKGSSSFWGLKEVLAD